MPPQKHNAIIGLGYVGLPLAVELGKHRPTLGFEINPSRINELQNGQDHAQECSPEEVKISSGSPRCARDDVKRTRDDKSASLRGAGEGPSSLRGAEGDEAIQGFYCGYSPERINTGDKEHRLPTIKKSHERQHTRRGRTGGPAPDHRRHAQSQQHSI